MLNPLLPCGYKVQDNITIEKELAETISQQIYRCKDGAYFLLITEEYHLFLEQNFDVKSISWEKIDISDNSYYWFVSQQAIFTLDDFDGIQSKSDLLAVGVSIKKFRDTTKDFCLYDALYIEEQSAVFPQIAPEKELSDDKVLTKLITSGVEIGNDNINKVMGMCLWLDKSDVLDIYKAAGIALKEETKEAAVKDEKTGEASSKKEPFELIGRPALKNFFCDYIVDVVENPEKYAKMGIDFPSAMILYGPPGCGKTFAVNKLVEYLGWPSYSIDANSIASPYIHQTGKLIAELFEKAMETAPSVVIIDEMESFVGKRSESVGSQHTNEEIAEFLRIIPEAISKKVLIFGMTNHLEMIDPAIKRTGRFDHIIEVFMPSAEEVEALITKILSTKPVEDDIDVEGLRDIFVGKPLSDVDYVLREAARLAAKNDLEKINQKCIDEAVAQYSANNKQNVVVKRHRPIGFIKE